MVIEDPLRGAVRQLQSVLESAGISTQGAVGQVGDPLHELAVAIEQGDIALRRDDGGQLVRESHQMAADIMYRSPQGDLFRLVEQKQVFRDGYEYSRQLEVSISRRVTPHDETRDLCMRIVRYGLGVDGALRVRTSGQDMQRLDSSEYPELPLMQIVHRYVVMLSDRQFKPEGYVEDCGDMHRYYGWEPVQEALAS